MLLWIGCLLLLFSHSVVPSSLQHQGLQHAGLPCPLLEFAQTLVHWVNDAIQPFHGEGNGNPLQYSCLENPMDGGAWWAAVHGVARSLTRLIDFALFFHFHALEKEMATHSSVLAWRIPGMGKPGGLPSMGSHRVGHDWSDLAAAATISSSAVPFSSYPQSFPACRSFLWVSSLHQMARVWNGYINIQVLAFTSFELLLSILSSSPKWIVGLYSISICNFLRNCHSVCHNGFSIVIQV